MFLDEARIAASIRHPNVCSVFDFGEDDGSFYLAMDYLEGIAFADVMRALDAKRDELSPRERCAFVARVFADVAEGLHAAHEARDPDGAPLEVVHRDVAPSNLFLRWDGVVSLLDFGCARARSRVFCSELGEARGHVAYVAPEVLRGREPDRRADVWSLGVVLWEALAGQRLFKRASVHDTLFAVVGDAVLAPSAVDGTVPEALDEIVLRALSRDPDGRHATALDLSVALRRFVAASGAQMETPDVSAFLHRLFPDADARRERVRITARSIPPEPTRRVSKLGHEPIVQARAESASFVDDCLDALRSRPVLAAMVLGLVVGLGGTFVAMQLDGAVRAEAAIEPPSELEGVPQSIPVPSDDAQAAGSSDQQRPHVPEQQSRFGTEHAVPHAPQ
jgi:serine/threonine-protein kinase